MKRVHTALNLPEAQLLVDLLGQRGIAARVFNANASSLAGEIPPDQARPQVWVDDPAQAQAARAAIEEYLRRPSHGPPRKCPRCGEDNPVAFEICWACGSELAG